jgi:hypothetical protein
VDKAEEIGLDWWRTDPHLSSHASRVLDDDLTRRLEAITGRLEQLEQKSPKR